MKKYRLILVSAIMFFAIACSNNPNKPENKSDTQMEFADKGQYTCPMHPEVLSDQAGDCPKCGMKLEKVTDKSADSVNAPVIDTI